MKTTYKRRTLEMANWKATNAVKQPEGDIPHENNLEEAHAMKTTYKRHRL